MKTTKILPSPNIFEADGFLNARRTNIGAIETEIQGPPPSLRWVYAKSFFIAVQQKLDVLSSAMATKALVALCLVGFTGSVAYAQTCKPCDTWLTGFVGRAPKMSDGGRIDAYVVGKLQSDTSLKYAANCMVGLKIFVNCKGEFSYDKMEYPNNILSAAQCTALLQTTEHIIDGIKELSPGTIGNQKKDFVFKLVVRVTHSGKAKTEILY